MGKTSGYRIAKMQEILGTDLDDIQADLSIWLALQSVSFSQPTMTAGSPVLSQALLSKEFTPSA